MPQEVEHLLDLLGRPCMTILRGRAFERPYVPPPTLRIVRPGTPLDLGTLDQSRNYLWIVDARGDFLLAPEQDPSHASLYPGRVYEAGSGRTDHGLKHADLAARAWDGRLPRMLRPPARIGGELRAERAATGLPTGKWIMNNNSAYNTRRTRLDRRYMGEKHLRLAHELLRASGLDASGIIVEPFRPAQPSPRPRVAAGHPRR